MRKLFLITALVAISILSHPVGAEQPGRYVRKQLKPSFFVPDKEFGRNEKLPEFNYYPNKPQKIIVKTEPVQKIEPEAVEQETVQVLEVINEVDMSDRRPVAETSVPVANVVSTTPIESKYINYDKDELAKTPEYQQKYDDYINDLKSIAQTGTTPENKRVSQDLSKMGTNERIVVDESFGLIPEAPSVVEETPAITVPSVEVIY